MGSFSLPLKELKGRERVEHTKQPQGKSQAESAGKKKAFIRGEETCFCERAHTHAERERQRQREECLQSKSIARTWKATIQPLHEGWGFKVFKEPPPPTNAWSVKTKTGRPTGPPFGGEHVLVWP